MAVDFDRKGEAMSARNRTKRLMFAMFCLNLVVMTNDYGPIGKFGR